MSVRLSVNVNKIATLRNARGGDVPNLVVMAQRIERAGAQGITVHPRPDERHIRRQDVFDLKPVVTTELNCEGYPSEDFLQLMALIKPQQCTLVPDPPHVLTSNAGWIVQGNESLLQATIERLHADGIRVSMFVDPVTVSAKDLAIAKSWGLDRIELYTEAYARAYHMPEREAVLARYVQTASEALDVSLGVNAGHDLDLHNLALFAQKVPGLLEVSIGHALIADALLFGIDDTIQRYLACLN
jgi:pyridoxine 5-phosphate synthase